MTRIVVGGVSREATPEEIAAINQSRRPTAAAVIEERNRRIAEGTTLLVNGVGIPLTGDPETRSNITSLYVRALDGFPGTVPVTDSAGVVHEMTADEIKALARQGQDWIMQKRAQASALIAGGIPADYRRDNYWRDA